MKNSSIKNFLLKSEYLDLSYTVFIGETYYHKILLSFMQKNSSSLTVFVTILISEEVLNRI